MPLAFRQIAHIAIFLRLNPGPAGLTFEHTHGLSKQQLRIDATCHVRRGPKVCNRNRDARPFSFNITLGHNLPFQPLIGQIGAVSIKTAVEG